MRLAELLGAVLIALFSAYLMWKSGEPPAWDPAAARFSNVGFVEAGELGTGTWPFFLALGMLLASLWIVLRWVRRQTPQSRSAEPFLDGYAIRMLVTVGGGLLAFLLLLGPVGFYGAIFAFFLYYMLFLGRHGVGLSVAVAVLFPIACFFFFDVAIRTVLPKGYLLEDAFVPLYAIFL